MRIECGRNEAERFSKDDYGNRIKTGQSGREINTAIPSFPTLFRLKTTKEEIIMNNSGGIVT